MGNATHVLPQMPTTACPEWCETDHAAEWTTHTRDVGKSYALPLEDGTVETVTLTPDTLTAHWEPLHAKPLGTVELTEAQTDVRVELQDIDGLTCLYIDRVGEITLAQARSAAAVLLAAADTLEAR